MNGAAARKEEFWEPLPDNENDSVVQDSLDDGEVVDFAAIYRRAAESSNVTITREAPVVPVDISALEEQPDDEKIDSEYQESPLERVYGVVDNAKEVIASQIDTVRTFITEKSRPTFEAMSDRGKKIAIEAFKGAAEVTGADRLMAKIGVLVHNRWADHHRGKLESITTKTTEQVTKLTNEISAATKNRTASEEALALLGELSPEQADRLKSDIDRQDERLAAFTNSLVGATMKQAEAIAEQQEKIRTIEATATAIGARYIEKVNKHLAPIEKSEQSAREAFEFFVTKEADAELKRQEKEAELMAISEKLVRLQAMRDSESLTDEKTIKTLDASIKKLQHDVEVATATIEQAREHAAHEKHLMTRRIDSFKKRRKPFEDRKKFFEERVASAQKKQERLDDTEPESDDETLSSPELAPEVSKPIVPSIEEAPLKDGDGETAFNVPESTPKTTSSEEIQTDDEGDTDETELTPESAEKIPTVRDYVQAWNTFVEKDAAALFPKNDVDRAIFIINEKSFIDDARTPGFYAEATVDKDTAATHMLGRLKRQIRSSRGYRTAAEFDARAEAAIKQFFAQRNA